jgi:uncharacterized membrane protein
MKASVYINAGRLFLALAILAIGVLQLVTVNFPSGFLPPTLVFQGKMALVYISGFILVGSAILLLINKYVNIAAILLSFYFLAIVLLVHLPAIVKQVTNAGEWAPAFEPFSLFSGLLILSGIDSGNKSAAKKGRNIVFIGRYLFATGLFVFAMTHFIYEKYVIMWIPGWIPFPVFWAWLVPIAFLGSFVSLIIQKYMRLSSLLLALMFFIWVLIVNLPRALTLKVEPEWTGTFIALGMSGIALLIAGSVNDERKV